MPLLTPKLLAPLPYHRAVVDLLKDTEPELWRWASSSEVLSEHSQAIRMELLKTSYRLDVEGHPEIIARCETVAQRLGVTAPVTLYQTGGDQLNASLFHLPGEAHIVFTGPILTVLKGDELEAILAHELAHYLLWSIDGGSYQIADRLLMSAVNDPRAAYSHSQTVRKFRLYTEIFADRGALVGSGELAASVAALVKAETGVSEVNAASYLRQADEIFSDQNITTKGFHHPELFVRARALRLWSEDDDQLDSWLTETIEGPLELDELDLVGQSRVSKLTRQFLANLLQPRWFSSEAVLAHARLMFVDFVPSTKVDDGLVSQLAETLKSCDKAMREYFCYLLLDFAAIDPDLEDLPLAAALEWSQRLELSEQFEPLVVKELGINKRQLGKLKKDAASLLAKAGQA